MNVETPTPSANGHAAIVDDPYVAAAAAAADRLADEATSIRDMLELEQELETKLETMLSDVKTRTKRLTRALAILEDEPATTAGPKPRETGPHGGTSHAGWSPSEETIKRALDGLIELTADGTAMTRTQVAAAIGMGGDTVRKAFDILREREQVRITAKTRGGGRLYLPMPDVIEAATRATA